MKRPEGHVWQKARTGAVALGVAVLVLWVLHREFHRISLADVWLAALSQDPARLLATAALTGVSFSCLASYDLFAARAVTGNRVPAGVALSAGAVATSITNTLGFHVVTGTLVRLRIYGRWGLGASEVFQIMSLSGLALGLGFLCMLGMSELLRGAFVHQPGISLVIGIGIAAVLAGFLRWLAPGHRTITFFRFRQPLPTGRLAAVQMMIGAVESAAAIGALYVLLPPNLAPSFSVFAVSCISAVALGVVSHAPGGIGVFEASLTAMLGGQGRADVLGALLLYRLIYNLAPFLLSLLCLAFATRGSARPNSKADIS